MPYYTPLPNGSIVESRGHQWIIQERAPDDDDSPAYWVTRVDGKQDKSFFKGRAMVLSCHIDRVIKK